jgi:hypothetical protein
MQNTTIKKIFLFLSIFIVVTLACDLSVTVVPSTSPVPLPTITMVAASPASNTQVISFQNGQGVRFLTEYAQYFLYQPTITTCLSIPRADQRWGLLHRCYSADQYTRAVRNQRRGGNSASRRNPLHLYGRPQHRYVWLLHLFHCPVKCHIPGSVYPHHQPTGCTDPVHADYSVM